MKSSRQVNVKGPFFNKEVCALLLWAPKGHQHAYILGGGGGWGRIVNKKVTLGQSQKMISLIVGDQIQLQSFYWNYDGL